MPGLQAGVLPLLAPLFLPLLVAVLRLLRLLVLQLVVVVLLLLLMMLLPWEQLLQPSRLPGLLRGVTRAWQGHRLGGRLQVQQLEQLPPSCCQRAGGCGGGGCVLVQHACRLRLLAFVLLLELSGKLAGSCQPRAERQLGVLVPNILRQVMLLLLAGLLPRCRPLHVSVPLLVCPLLLLVVGACMLGGSMSLQRLRLVTGILPARLSLRSARILLPLPFKRCLHPGSLPSTAADRGRCAAHHPMDPHGRAHAGHGVAMPHRLELRLDGLAKPRQLRDTFQQGIYAGRRRRLLLLMVVAVQVALLLRLRHMSCFAGRAPAGLPTHRKAGCRVPYCLLLGAHCWRLAAAAQPIRRALAAGCCRGCSVGDSIRTRQRRGTPSVRQRGVAAGARRGRRRRSRRQRAVGAAGGGGQLDAARQAAG